MRKLQMVDLSSQYQRIKSEIDSAIQEVIDTATFINGIRVYEFAEHLSTYLGVKHVIPCANGTDAIQISLMALNLQPGDEVIVPVHTYVATAEAIAVLKLKPVFVDVNEDDFTINITQLESLISSKTRAVVPVHLYGQCANMEALKSFAIKYDISIIEDTAQAIGAKYYLSDGSNKMAGAIGDLGTTSFFPSKNLGCFGDGGAIFTNDDDLATKCKLVANHGQTVKYHHDIVGCNSRLDTLQAAVLDVKLKYLNEYIDARQKVASYYDTNLMGLASVSLPYRSSKSTHVFHQYTVKIEKNRDLVKELLGEVGIPSMIYYPIPLHRQNAYKHLGSINASYPVTERLSKSVLSLPIHTEMIQDDQDYIIENFIKIVKEVNG